MLAPLAILSIVQNRPEPDWLPVLDAPRNLSHELTLPVPNRPGPKIEIRGRVFKSDGKTPAPGVIVYFHHTDALGIYPQPERPIGWSRWHGSIRGWLKTNARGEYVLRTTRPAPYPGGTEPAHIHAYGLAPESRSGFFFDDILFDGDLLIDDGYWRRVERFGTRPYQGMRVSVDSNGVQQGHWDFKMPR